MKLGFLYLEELGMQDEAIAEFQEELRVMPRYSWPLRGIAEAIEQKGNLEEAIEYHRKAAGGVLREARQFLALASALARKKDLRGTTEAMAGALAVNSVHTRASSVWRDLLGRLSSEVAAEDPGKLIALLEGLLRPGERDPLLLRTLALLLARESRARDPEKARRYARQALEQSEEDDLEAAADLAEVEFLLGERKEAVLLLEAALGEARSVRAPPRLLDECRQTLLPDLPSFATIEALLTAPPREYAIPIGALWRFDRGRSEPPADWKEPLFDDASWEAGASGFGYGCGRTGTRLDDMRGCYTTLYARHAFEVPDPGRFERWSLAVCADDGFVAWFNGKELGRQRAGAPREAKPWNAVASAEAPEPSGWTTLAVPRELLRPGRNVLALQGLNRRIGDGDFTLVPGLTAEMPHDPQSGHRLVAGFRSMAEGESGAKLLAYLEGRVLELDGRPREAAERLAAAAGGEAASPLPILHLAGCLRGLGDPSGAENRLRSALVVSFAASRDVWELWVTVSRKDLGRQPDAILASWPAALDGGGPGGDVRWLLERLARGEAIRIDCGSDADRRSADGVLWSCDRFFTGGSVALELGAKELAGAEEGKLHETQRRFPCALGEPQGYRLPGLTGKLQVTLHFAELEHRERGLRRFDIALEGQTVREAHEPLAAGFAAAQVEVFEVQVDDGALDVTFTPRAGEPAVAAIEVRSAD
jgi:tetratricopeptide (TPR) repeat protein